MKTLINWEQISKDIQAKKDATKATITDIENYIINVLQPQYKGVKIGLVYTRIEKEIEENNQFLIWIGDNYPKHKFISISEIKEVEEEKIYWYEFTLRGFSPYCQPKGHKEVNNIIGRYGIIAYNRQLTNEELSEYELRPYRAS